MQLDMGALLPFLLAGVVAMAVVCIGVNFAGELPMQKTGIFGYFGRRGTGKSFFAVTRARIWRRSNLTGPVWTNAAFLELPSTCGKYCPGTPEHVARGCGPIYTSIDHEQFLQARDGLVIIDEMGRFFPSSLWNKLPMTALMHLADTRKLGIQLHYSAHTPARVSKNLREITDESYTLESWKLFGFFIAHVYEGCLDEKTTWQLVPFRGAVKRSYRTEEIIQAPAVLQGDIDRAERKARDRVVRDLQEAAEPRALGRASVAAPGALDGAA